MIPVILLTAGLYCEPWVIVANGAPFSSEALEDVVRDRKVLVLDGAINRFKALTFFYPDCLLGDFDSIEDPDYWGVSAAFSKLDGNSPPYEGNFGMMIIPAKDQNHTDLEKGIIYCDQLQATSIHIIQATGGRMDHTLGNLGLLRKYHRTDRHLFIETEKERIFYLCDEEMSIEGGEGECCAILGYPRAFLTTYGLAYNSERLALELGIQESICNTLIENQSRVVAEGEVLVILPKSCRFQIRRLSTFSSSIPL